MEHDAIHLAGFSVACPFQADSTLTNLYDFVIWALNPKTLNPKPETLNPKPYFRVLCRSSTPQSCLGHFPGVATATGAFWKVHIPYRSLVEALYTLNSPPVLSFTQPKPLNPKP